MDEIKNAYENLLLRLMDNNDNSEFDDAIDDMKLWFQCLEAEHGK